MPARPSWWGLVDALPPDQRARAIEALANSLAPLRLRYTPYTPTAKQEAFLRLPDREAFYGGAAGPGKSTALMMAALQYIDVPGYAGLLLRRTYADLALPGALMEMARDWLADTDLTEDKGEKTWTLPGGGTLTFGYLQSEDDKRRYSGAAFQYIGFDELTHFTESQYTFLFSRLRRPSASRGAAPDGTTINHVPLRMRSASNPGGPGHAWVRRRFVNPTTRRDGARYVAALLDENPHLDVAAYLESLAHLSPIELARLRRGDWTATDGGSVYDTTKLRTMTRAALDDLGYGTGGVTAVRRWDLAATEPSQQNPDPDYTAGALVERCRKTGLYVVRDVTRFRATSDQVERRIASCAKADGRAVHVWIEQEPGASGKSLVAHYARNVLPGYAVRGDRPTGDKEVRARPSAAAVGNGLVVLLEGRWNAEFVEELDAFPGGEHDDQVDAFTGAHDRASRSTTLRIA